jgi:Respiratory-chain NADH dehydrogenase 51 Kd subunit
MTSPGEAGTERRERLLASARRGGDQVDGVPARRSPAGRRSALTADTRLTAGWHQTRRPARLAGHVSRYGPLPSRDWSRGQLADAVAEARLTGRGGAGFPTGVKLRSVASRRGLAVVIANGMESEPLSRKDQALLARAPHLVPDGAVVAALATGATTVHVCLDSTRSGQADAVRSAAQERSQSGHDPVPIQVHELPHRYTASEASARALAQRRGCKADDDAAAAIRARRRQTSHLGGQRGDPGPHRPHRPVRPAMVPGGRPPRRARHQPPLMGVHHTEITTSRTAGHFTVGLIAKASSDHVGHRTINNMITGGTWTGRTPTPLVS